MAVARLLSMVAEPQIAPLVVVCVRVDMVDLLNRKCASHHAPDNPVRKKVSFNTSNSEAKYPTLRAPMWLEATRNFASVLGVPHLIVWASDRDWLPAKLAGFGIIV